jgi:hypothetical protein
LGPSCNKVSSSLLHPDTLARSLCTTSSLALHPLDREVSAIGARFRVVALCVPLLAAKSVLLILLCALGVRLAITPAAVGGFGVVVEGNVEEILFVCIANLSALSFYDPVSIYST